MDVCHPGNQSLLELLPFFFFNCKPCCNGLPWWLSVKECTCHAGDIDLIPGSGRFPGEGNGNPLQFLAWRTTRMEEPGRLHSMGLQRVGQD